MGSFFSELKRRNVVRVAVAYIVVAWLGTQIAETLFPAFGTPDWVFKTLVLLVAIGFPFALLFAWAFELTPEGIKKTHEVDASASLTHSTGRRLDFMIIATLVVALGYFIYERQSLVDPTDSVEATMEQASPGEIEVLNAVADTRIRRTIAVLPFLNMSSDDEQAWFADGLTEEILNALARAPDLLVSARTSSFAYKGTTKNISTIAQELGVNHILEGSVRRGGDRLRVTAQLIRAEDGFHLWSQTYDKTLDDVIQIQEDVAVEIAKALKTAMDPEALAQMMSAGTSSVPAFEAYLEGLAYGISSSTTGDVYQYLSASQAFERAIEIDPTFARAHWESALFWGVQLGTANIYNGLTDIPRDDMTASYQDAIENAIRFERDPVSVLVYRANKASQETRLVRSLRLITEYLEKRPNDQAAQMEQLSTLSSLRRYDDAISAGLAFYERDGRDPFVVSQTMELMRYSKDNELQRSFTRKALERFDDSTSVVYQAHRTLLWAGDIDGSSRLLPRIESSDLPEDTRYLSNLRQACAERRLDDAQKLVAAHYARTPDDASDGQFMTWLTHKILGEDAAALAGVRDLDDSADLRELVDYSTYGSFDARELPNLMALLESQGVDDFEPRINPIRCKR